MPPMKTIAKLGIVFSIIGAIISGIGGNLSAMFANISAAMWAYVVLTNYR